MLVGATERGNREPFCGPIIWFAVHWLWRPHLPVTACRCVP
jgi:hypothetical protein